MELDILKKRLDVMQQEVREVLTVVNKDFDLFMKTVVTALNANAARIERIEQHLGLGVITADVPVREDGKEL